MYKLLIFFIIASLCGCGIKKPLELPQATTAHAMSIAFVVTYIDVMNIPKSHATFKTCS